MTTDPVVGGHVKARLTSLLTALVATLVACAVIAPAPASAVRLPIPLRPAATVPDGHALIHVDAGTAVARKLDSGQYRIVVPRNMEITWLGEVGGRARVGTFTPRALVRAWGGMGYSRSVKAVATLVWGLGAANRRLNHRVVLISDPQVLPGGRLTFLATPVRGDLPRVLSLLNVHVMRAGAVVGAAGSPVSVATTTFDFTPVAIDPAGTASVQASQTDGITATVNWPATVGTTPCRGPINVTIDPAVGMGSIIFPGFPCGDGSVSSKVPYPSTNPLYRLVQLDSTVMINSSPTDPSGTGMIWVQFGYTPTGSTQFYFGQTIAMWDATGCILSCPR